MSVKKRFINCMDNFSPERIFGEHYPTIRENFQTSRGGLVQNAGADSPRMKAFVQSGSRKCLHGCRKMQPVCFLSWWVDSGLWKWFCLHTPLLPSSAWYKAVKSNQCVLVSCFGGRQRCRLYWTRWETHVETHFNPTFLCFFSRR